MPLTTSTNHMNLTPRIIAVIAVFVVTAIGLYWILGEVAVCYEMWATGASSRMELVNDFGLGLIGLFVVVPASALGALIVAIVAWRKLSKPTY